MIGAYPQAIASLLSSLAMRQQAHDPALDSVRVESPLPGGVAEVVRFLLTTVPQWVQKAGIAVALAVAVAIIWFLFKHRHAILGWIFSRPTGVKAALAAAAIVIIGSVAWAGTVTWNYTQHSNEFCSGCHVMNVAYSKMAGGETEHAKLSCHDCHQQSIYASAHQFYLWISERPEKIEKHADVPNGVCEKCHVTQDTAGWQRIASTAGHRVHLESDSSSLKDVKCIDCHGTELHRFEPAKQTCGQAGCHDEQKTGITLAKMAGQTVRHCTVCHRFTADVPALATRDSARGSLVPGASECFSCHQMKEVLPDFDERRDPHGAKCGSCHNPHTQKVAGAAAKTCEDCHSNWREEPFHVGAAHRRVAAQCLTCHRPHSAKVDASSCEACHLSVRARGRFTPPLPFDTAAALRRSNIIAPHKVGSNSLPGSVRHAKIAFARFDRVEPPRSRHDALALFASPTSLPPLNGVWRPPPQAAVPDSFSHSRHEKLACLVCHETGTGHGLLTFARPRGCQICHHQAPARSRCVTCHETAEYAAPQRVTAVVTVPGQQPRPRPVEFLHAVHKQRVCTECHTTPVTLALSPAKAACSDCHDDHHTVDRACSSCHSASQPKTAHNTLDAAHQRCDACHTATTVARLTPTRDFCSTCHLEQAKTHYPQKECTACHFLTDPATYRSSIVSRPRE